LEGEEESLLLGELRDANHLCVDPKHGDMQCVGFVPEM
jgi:hypothetical protein